MSRLRNDLYCVEWGVKLYSLTRLMLLWSNHHYHSVLPTCFTSSLEPASYITQNSSSELLIPLPATFIWTCRFNLLHATILSPSITFHCITPSSKPTFSENLILHLSLFLSVGLISWLDYRPFTGVICSLVFYVLVLFLSVRHIYFFLRATDKVGQLSGQLLGARKNSDWLIDTRLNCLMPIFFNHSTVAESFTIRMFRSFTVYPF